MDTRGQLGYVSVCDTLAGGYAASIPLYDQEGNRIGAFDTSNATEAAPAGAQ